MWVAKDARGLQIGRRLLTAGLRLGKPKDVRLLVAGSEENPAAVGLYESVGFHWTSELRSEMVLEKSRLPAEDSAAVAAGAAAAPSEAANAHAIAAAEKATSGLDVVASAATQAASTDEVATSSSRPTHAAQQDLCVQVGGFGEAGSSMARATMPGTSSGVTPGLTHLRLSPRLSSRRFPTCVPPTSTDAVWPSPSAMPMPPSPTPREGTEPLTDRIPSTAGKRRISPLAVDSGSSATTAPLLPADRQMASQGTKARRQSREHASPRSPAHGAVATGKWDSRSSEQVAIQ